MSDAEAAAEVVGWAMVDVDRTPPWAEDNMPEPALYVESELFVAGALSTMPPFDNYHPAWALPFARLALNALSEWEPNA